MFLFSASNLSFQEVFGRRVYNIDHQTVARNRLDHDCIVQALVAALEPLDYVHALWEGGAAAFDRVDEWSDIDLYVVADDDKVDETFSTVEHALRSLSPIEQKYEVAHPSESGIFQAFYQLEKASEYLLIDLAVLKLSSPDKFLEPQTHGEAVFYLRKYDKIKIPRLNRKALTKKLQKRQVELRTRFDMFNIFVQKEINRKNSIEAITIYQNFTLGTLVEALRMKHNPVHHDFKTRYAHYELPTEVIEKLKAIYYVRSESDLQKKYREATRWCRELLSETQTIKLKSQ